MLWAFLSKNPKNIFKKQTNTRLCTSFIARNIAKSGYPHRQFSKLTFNEDLGIISLLRAEGSFMFKKIITVLLFIGLVSAGCGKKEAFNDDLTTVTQRDKLIIGVKDDTKPFGYRDNQGKLTGYDIELSRLIAQAILGSKDKVEFVPVTPSNRIMKLNTGEVDMLIATMSVTNQRQQVLDFSIPYYIAGQAIMVNSDSRATTIRDFAGKKMIIVFGSTSEKNLRMNVPEVVVMGYKTYPEAYQALKARKADAMVADDTILLGFTLSDKSVKLLPKRYSREPYAAAFRKGEESLRLQEKVNYVIESLQSTGRLKRMQEQWGIK